MMSTSARNLFFLTSNRSRSRRLRPPQCRLDAALGRHDCALEGACLVKSHWSAVNDAVRGALSGVSLATLAAPAAPAAMLTGIPG